MDHNWQPLTRVFGHENTAMDLKNWVQCRRCGAILYRPDESTPFKTEQEAMAAQSVNPDCDTFLVSEVMRK